MKATTYHFQVDIYVPDMISSDSEGPRASGSFWYFQKDIKEPMYCTDEAPLQDLNSAAQDT